MTPCLYVGPSDVDQLFLYKKKKKKKQLHRKEMVLYMGRNNINSKLTDKG